MLSAGVVLTKTNLIGWPQLIRPGIGIQTKNNRVEAGEVEADGV
jgi:hypothetical protein